MSEGHHSVLVLGWGFDGTYRVMAEGISGLAWEAKPRMKGAELELDGSRVGGPRVGGSRGVQGAHFFNPQTALWSMQPLRE